MNRVAMAIPSASPMNRAGLPVIASRSMRFSVAGPIRRARSSAHLPPIDEPPPDPDAPPASPPDNEPPDPPIQEPPEDARASVHPARLISRSPDVQ